MSDKASKNGLFSRVSSVVTLSRLRWFALLSLMVLVFQTALVGAANGGPLRGNIAAEKAARAAMTPKLNTVTTADGREALADRVIVGFRDNVSVAERSQVHNRLAARGISAKAVQSVGRGAEQVQVSGAASLEAALQAYRQDSTVAYAEPDYVLHVSLTPNDPSFGSQYGMSKIQAPSAWNVTTGSSSVKVAILDCGIYESGSSQQNGYPGHPDINGKVVLRRDFTGSSTGSDDYCDHGTHVAGIAAAKTNNGVGVAGVGFNVSLINGKVLGDNGSGSTTNIANGIYWAADNGAKVINMSLGGAGSCTSTFQNAIDYAYNKNVVVVVAAGNNGTTALQSPASCNHVIAVASTDSADAKSSFSTYGTWVEVAAPGSNIYSLNYSGSYVNKSGTSMATPHVAGLAGLVWSTGKYSTAQQVIDKIQSSADRISGTGSYWIYGRVNAYRAVS